MKEYDVVVIGSGPGGYVAAIKSAQLGLETALIEKDDSYGGTCLNVGCIPTKVMIHSSELYDNMNHIREHGVVVENVHFDMDLLHKRKKKIVTKLTKGVAYLLKKNKVTTYQGRGSFVDPHTIAIMPGEGDTEEIKARHVIIATGSVPKELPHIKFDGERILNSTHMLDLPEPPKSLAVIGAGAVGVEFASIYAFLGSQVTLIEMLPHLLPLEDEEISLELEKAFKKRRIDYHLNSVVKEVRPGDDGMILVVKDKEGNVRELQMDKVLLAVGRAPYTDGLSLEYAGLKPEKGFIPVDELCRTEVEHIFAIGDVVATPQLAHLASAEGIMVAKIIAGQAIHPVNYSTVPACTYSFPQVGSTGLSEKAAREKGHDVKIGKFPFSAIGKAMIENSTDGFIKIVTDAKLGEVLGVHIIGAIATEHISEMVLAINLECTAEELALAIHPHPTISEALMEAAHAAHDLAIHI
ncbi:MAG: dihydrolipoyl dehydrogenase [Acidobacteria bacterium]|nr:dihydrolipoyl dehydrogenase [Acidobacteriota bacterium]